MLMFCAAVPWMEESFIGGGGAAALVCPFLHVCMNSFTVKNPLHAGHGAGCLGKYQGM